MQPIERFGVVALVFLIVTIAAVVIWGPEGESSPTAAAKEPTATRTNVSRLSPDTWRTPGQSPSRTTSGWAPDAPLSPGSGSSSLPSSTGKAGKAGASERELERDALAAAQVLREKRLGQWRSNHDTGDPAPAASSKPGPSAGSVSSGSSGQQAHPVAATPTPGSSPRAGTYVVKPGDTLSEIALEQLGTSKRWTEIRDLNGGVDPAGLRVGMVLRMPGGAPAARAGSGASAPPVAAKPKVNGSGSHAGPQVAYRVKSGDSLWRIAERELGDGTRWGEIEKLNPGAASGSLMVGRVLQLPADARSAAAPAKTLVASAEPAPAPTAGKVR